MSLATRLKVLEKKSGISDSRIVAIHAYPDESDKQARNRENVTDDAWVFRNSDDPAAKYSISGVFFTSDKATYEAAKPEIQRLVDTFDADILGPPKYRMRVTARNIYELANSERQLLIETDSTPLLATGLQADRLKRLPVGMRLSVTGTMTEVRDVNGKTIEAIKIQEVHQ